SEKSENDGARARTNFDPRLLGAEYDGAEGGPDDQLRDGADDDLGQRSGDPEPTRWERCIRRKAEPQRCQSPNSSHVASLASCSSPRGVEAGAGKTKPALRRVADLVSHRMTKMR